MPLQILVFITCGKLGKLIQYKNQFKISAPTWNDKFELRDGSCSVSNIQNYFEYILKNHGENIDKPSAQIYVNKIENRVTFKIKDGYSLELLTPEALKIK